MNTNSQAWTAAAVCLALAACSPPEAKTGAPSAESHAPGTTASNVAGACGAYPKGAPGVVNTFCDGPATINLTVGDKDYSLHGGTCATQASIFNLNLGVVAGPDLAGALPDYVGLTTASEPGAFSNAVLTVIVGGKSYPLTSNTGVLTTTGGQFQGVTVTDGVKVSGTFTC